MPWWIACVASLISGGLAGTVGGWDLAEHVGASVPLFAIVGGVSTGVAASIQSCSGPKPPDDSPRRRRTIVYREIVIIGVLLPIVFPALIPVDGFGDVFFWAGTVAWIASVVLLYAEFVIGRLQEAPKGQDTTPKGQDTTGMATA